MTDREPLPPLDERAIERERLIRQVRQRLQGLGLAGIGWIESPRWQAGPPKRGQSAISAPASSPISRSPVEPPGRLANVVERDRPPAEPVALAAILPKAAPAVPLPTRPASPPPVMLSGSLFEESGFESPAPSPEEKVRLLEELSREVASCVRCPALASTRTQIVFASGDPNADLMFVGEAPGEDEDRAGKPFIGRAGQLLTDMITKGMGLSRDQVYIANVVKCRPVEPVNRNRQPTPQEMTNCRRFIERQIEIVRPKYLCLLGKSAATSLLETESPMKFLRNKWFRYRGIPTLVTYHPSYLLRTPEDKKLAWEDLKRLMQAMGIQPPERRKD